MALLDGTYEILSEESLGSDQLCLHATAPDGRALRIVWFDLDRPEKQIAFERYRKVLRSLRRKGLTAIHDLVSRPGAHYVAWYHSTEPPLPVSSRRVRDLEAELKQNGYSLDDADVRYDPQAGALLYGLAFEGTLPAAPEPPVITPSPPRRRERLGSFIAKQPAWVLSWGLATLLGLTGLAFLGISLLWRTNDSFTVVPDLIGQPLEQVSKDLSNRGLNVSFVAVTTPGVDREVLALNPPVGTQLRPGQTIEIRYGIPEGEVPEVEVPELTGLAGDDALERAEDRLNAVGLQLGRVVAIHANIPRGTIVSQSVPVDAPLPRGGNVDVLLSDGPTPVQTFVPDLVGLPLAEAEALARTAGIVGEIYKEYVPTTRSPSGTVLGQNLNPNHLVERERAVLRLIVAGLKEDRSVRGTVPDLTGMPEPSALVAAPNFRVQSEVIANPNLNEGVVMQFPEPGELVSGGPLTVIVNTRPKPVPIPTPVVDIKGGEPRYFLYRWYIEPGIGRQFARVFATTLSGAVRQIDLQTVSGGEYVQGVWTAEVAGPVEFRLTLGGNPYGDVQRVNP